MSIAFGRPRVRWEDETIIVSLKMKIKKIC